MRALARLRSLDRRVQWAIFGVAVLVGLNLLALLLEALYGGEARGRPSSSYATVKQGTAAWARLLERFDHPVERLREPPSEADVSAGSTLVVLGPNQVADADVRSLRDFVDDGGRLVIGGRGAQPWLAELVDSPPVWTAEGETTAGPLADAAEVEGISTVSTSGFGSWAEEGDAEPLLGGDLVVAAVMNSGAGRIIFVADPSLVDNDHLARVDNAAFALAVAGEDDGPVVFAETFHGYGERSGWGLLPTRAKWVFGGLTLGGLLWILARSRRLGPPEQTIPRRPPARLAYVEAVASGMARSKQRGEALEPLYERAVAIMERRGLVSDRGVDSLLAAARASGLDEEQARALIQGPTDDDDVLNVGTAFARLSKGER
ncbi:MAG: DUF4350 domain-containing protein [Actinomycetota bacterium]|nr:DUF4350 domain-containing protein [Actinomycetota bacterium]